MIGYHNGEMEKMVVGYEKAAIGEWRRSRAESPPFTWTGRYNQRMSLSTAEDSAVMLNSGVLLHQQKTGQ
jgi:hypothetical protein